MAQPAYLPQFPLPVDPLALFGELLLAGLATGELVRRVLRLPRIVGYVLIGLALGASGGNRGKTFPGLDPASGPHRAPAGGEQSLLCRVRASFVDTAFDLTDNFRTRPGPPFKHAAGQRASNQKKPRRRGVQLDCDERTKFSRKRIRRPFSRAAASPVLLQLDNNIHNFSVTDVLGRIFVARGFGRFDISHPKPEYP